MYICILCVRDTGQGSIYRNIFKGGGGGGGKGEMVRGKCTLGRGLGPSPQENVSLPLSQYITIGKKFGGEAFPHPQPPSRLNPVIHNIYCKAGDFGGKNILVKGQFVPQSHGEEICVWQITGCHT